MQYLRNIIWQEYLEENAGTVTQMFAKKVFFSDNSV